MRHARWHQAEIALGIGPVLLLPFLAQPALRSGSWSAAVAFACVLLLVVQPIAVIRLVEHFMPVPRRAFWSTVAGAAVGFVALVVLRFPRPPLFAAAAATYFSAVQGYVAWLFLDEARRRAGITRLRLFLAGAGAATAVALVLVEGVDWISGARLPLLLYAAAALAMMACYGLGLAPPRRVLRAWQERAFVRLLRQTAERAPGEREDQLPDDLNEAAAHGLTAAATAVLLGRNHLNVYATSESTLRGLAVTPEVGLVGVAFNGVNPVVGSADECERPLNERMAGEVVAAIPIARTSPGWGVLLVAQRRASVYQTEDLSLLGRLCRHAADVLDHSRLLHEEQRRHLSTAEPREHVEQV